MLKIADNLGSYTIAAGEPWIMSVQMRAMVGNALLDWSNRRLVLSFYDAERTKVDQIEGVYSSDDTGPFFAFIRDGRFSEALYGRSLQVELAERLLDGRSIIATGPLTIAPTSNGVASFGSIIGRVDARFTLYFNAAGLIQLVEQELLAYGGGPSVPPSPSIQTPAAISSDGTPQVGEQLTGVDPVFRYASITRRRWLRGTTALSTSQAYTPDATGAIIWSVDGVGDDGSPIKSESTITVAAATSTPTPTPPGTPPSTVVTSSGLLLRDTSDLAGWSNPDGSWGVQTAPAILAAPRSAIVAQAPSPNMGVDADAGGIREGFLFEDDDGRWFIFYGAGNGSESNSGGPWKPQYAISTDRGLNWTKKGPLTGMDRNKGDGTGLWASCDNLFIEKRASKYYLHRLTAGGVTANQICGQPYYSDVWTADSIEGTWTYQRMTLLAGAGGQADDRDSYASCMVLHNGTYHLFYSSTSQGGSYNCGLATGTSPAGPFTKVNAALIPAAMKMEPENPEVYWDAVLNKWVMFTNEVQKNDIEGTGGGTDRNRVYFSDSLTDWTNATWNEVQRTVPCDGVFRIGMGRIKRNSDNLPRFDAFGNTGFIFDADPSPRNLYHTDRKLFYSQAEPSTKGMRLNAPSGSTTSTGGSGSVSFDDFQAYNAGNAGGQGDWIDGSGSNNKPLIVVEGASKVLDLRSSVGPSIVYSTSEAVPQGAAKYAIKCRIGVGSGFGVGFGFQVGRTFLRVDVARSPNANESGNFTWNVLTQNGSSETVLSGTFNIEGVQNGADGQELQLVVQLNANVVSVSINGKASDQTYTLDAAGQAAAGAAGTMFFRNGYGGGGERVVKTVGVYAPATAIDWGGTSGGSAFAPSMKALAHTDFVAEFAVMSLAATGGMEFFYMAQSGANASNCYRLTMALDNAGLFFQKAERVAAGNGTQLATTLANTKVKTAPRFYVRVKIVVSGGQHRIYADGELQLSFNDSTYTTGAAIGLRGTTLTTRAEIRNLTVRKADTVTVNGLTSGQRVTLRGAGGVPLATAVASGSSLALSTVHYPAATIDVNNVPAYQPTGGIWGGDVYGGGAAAT